MIKSFLYKILFTLLCTLMCFGCGNSSNEEKTIVYEDLIEVMVTRCWEIDCGMVDNYYYWYIGFEYQITTVNPLPSLSLGEGESWSFNLTFKAIMTDGWSDIYLWWEDISNLPPLGETNTIIANTYSFWRYGAYQKLESFTYEGYELKKFIRRKEGSPGCISFPNIWQ